MTKKKKEILVSVLFLVISIFVFFESIKIEPLMENELGSGFFPKIVASLMIVLSLLHIAINLIKNNDDQKDEKTRTDLYGGFITILLIGLYALFYQKVGFIISSAIYLFLQILVLAPREKRNIVLFLLLSVIVPIFIYFVFTRLINMPLPRGIWGF